MKSEKRKKKITAYSKLEIGGSVLRESTRYLSDVGYEYCEKFDVLRNRHGGSRG